MAQYIPVVRMRPCLFLSGHALVCGWSGQDAWKILLQRRAQRLLEPGIDPVAQR